jgi:SAM-dependent methyltransferase
MHTGVSALRGTREVRRCDTRQSPVATDWLWRHLVEVPAFRALLRAAEADLYSRQVFPHPILDLGCGDGHFASVLSPLPLDVGCDLRRRPLVEASKRECHRVLAQADGYALPCADGTFGTIICNSVLEHTPVVEPVLGEAHRVLIPPRAGCEESGGLLFFSVPSREFTTYLAVGRVLEAIGLRGAAVGYRRAFNRVSRHVHCDEPSLWKRRLQAAGFRVECCQPYFPSEAVVALELGHYFGVPCLVSKLLFGRWIICPKRANLLLTERVLRPVYESSLRNRGGGAYLFFKARKTLPGVELDRR